METVLIIIITLSIYSTISTVAFILSKENDKIITIFGLGIFGCLLMGLCWVIRKIINWNKYHDKRSIIEITQTKEQKWCNLKDTNDIYAWHEGYKLMKRYADKNEWNKLKPFDKEFISQCKINCDNCIHDGKECDPNGKTLCKDMNKFDMFMKK